MKYRRLGRTDIEVSVVAMGCWAIADPKMWGPQDESDAVAAIHTALDAGVTLFDTAEGYGDGASESLLGRALGPHRHEVVLATKAGREHQTRDELIAACERSLRRLRTDTIDLYQLHWPNHDVPFDETAAALDELVRQGKVRVAGVSNFGPRDLRDFLGRRRVETDQVCYSLLFRAPEHELLPACVENDVSVLCYSPLAASLLTGKFRRADDVPPGRARTRHFRKDRELARHSEAGAEAETFEAIDRIRRIAEGMGRPMADVALAWLLRRDAVASVIAGARTAAQAAENAAAADLELPDDALDELDEVTRPLKEILGPNLDPWQTESRIR